MILDQLRRQAPEIAALAVRFGARRIRVFGSVARGQERADSDVDFLVDLPHGYDMLRQRLPLARHLAAIAGRPVDVVPEHELSPYIRDRVLGEAVDL